MDGATGILLRALAFAAERHSGQRRKDAAASPYINHPIALADVLACRDVFFAIQTWPRSSPPDQSFTAHAGGFDVSSLP